MIIKDPEVAKLFADDTRRGILHMLRHHEMSTTDLAKALEKSHSSIIHHLNLLKDADLVAVTRTERVRNMVQTYYQSTAKRFIISYSLSEAISGEGGVETWRADMLQNTMEGLKAYGVEVPEEERDRALKLMDTFFLREQKALEETVEQQVELGTSESWHNRQVIQLLSRIKLSDDREHAKVVRELKGLLKPMALKEEGEDR
jgi:DNA-binding transcriptional ArsR family regulator